jgi:hypothetical protein
MPSRSRTAKVELNQGHEIEAYHVVYTKHTSYTASESDC